MQYEELTLPYKYYFQRIKADPLEFEITGYDTETLNGYCRLLCDSSGQHVTTTNFMDIYNFLVHQAEHKHLKTFFNLDYDVRSIIKYLPRQCQQELYYENETLYSDIIIRWLPGKSFTVKKGRLNYTYYDIAQFYNMSLDKAAGKYLNSGKTDYDVTNLTETDFSDNLEEMIKYCIQDCKLTKDLTRLQADKFHKLGISFFRPISRANMSERFVINNVKLPAPQRNRINRLAFYSYYGGRFELQKRGYFPLVYCYDINSAYPYIIKDLPHPTDMLYYKVDDYEPDARIAYYDITVKDAYDNDISPLTFSNKGINIYPNTDSHRFVLSQPELEYIRKQKGYDYEVNEAYAIHELTEERPFKFIEELYKLRKEVESEDPVFAQSIKIIMNSLYGKFWQITGLVKDVTTEEDGFDIIYDKDGIFKLYKKIYKAGYFFNPVFASHITSSVRMQLVNTCKGYFPHIIGFHTDSVITSKPFIKESKELGGWSLDLEGEGVFLQTGLYTIRNDTDTKHKRRGGTSKEVKSWFDLLESNKTSGKIKQSISHVVSLGDIFHFDKLFSIEDLNKFTTITRTIDVGNDKKREWYYQPETFNDLLTDNVGSTPLTI